MKMREISLSYHLDDLMLQAPAFEEALQKRKIPPEEEKVEELVDERIVRMMLKKQV